MRRERPGSEVLSLSLVAALLPLDLKRMPQDGVVALGRYRTPTVTAASCPALSQIRGSTLAVFACSGRAASASWRDLEGTSRSR